MRKLILLLPFCGFSFLSKAQHCGFDFASIIVVNVHAQNDTSVINNLKISLVDSLGNTFTNTQLRNGYWTDKNNDTLFLWQDPVKVNLENQSNNNLVSSATKQRFINLEFVKNNYFIVLGTDFSTEGYSLLIEDTDEKKNQGSFKTKYYPLTKDNIHHLCGKYDKKEWNEIILRVTLQKIK